MDILKLNIIGLYIKSCGVEVGLTLNILSPLSPLVVVRPALAILARR